MGRRGKCKCFGPKIETYGLDFEKPRPYELRSAQKNVASLRGPRGDSQLSACSRRPSSGLGLLGLLVEEDPVRSPPKLTGTGVPFQADGVAPVLAGLDGLHEAFAGAAPVCETKSLQQLPGTYIFNKKVNIAHQLEDMLHACRPEPATRALKFP